MKLLVFGLGNKGEEYQKNRHNTGAIVCSLIAKKFDGSRKVKFVEVDDFMNNSGKTIGYYIKTKKDLKKLVVIYDDMDLPLGNVRIAFNRSSGGHNGLESIIKKYKSKEFIRIRVGVSPTTPKGKIRKPKGEAKTLKFLLGDFKKDELTKIKRVSKKIGEAIEVISEESLGKAMSLYNN
jgi:PTH1 family peptidyl-tRNA hydrolase